MTWAARFRSTRSSMPAPCRMLYAKSRTWVSPAGSIHRIGIGSCPLVQAVRRTTPHARAILDLVTIYALCEKSYAVFFNINSVSTV